MKRFLAIAALALFAAPIYSQTLTFTVETSTSGGSAVVPRLTWSTTPAAGSCTASNGWSGTKAAAGVELLAAINATKSYTLTCSWPGIQTAIVTWIAPTTNTDGSPYTDPNGFRVQYGLNPADLDQSVYLPSSTVLTWTSPTLGAGTWSFGVRAVNALGLESAISNVTSKVLSASASQTRTLEIAIKFPSPPTNAAAK